MNNINIKELRESKGMTKVELANKSGIKVTNLYKYESGATAPRIETMNKMLEALGLHLKVTYELVEWSGENE